VKKKHKHIIIPLFTEQNVEQKDRRDLHIPCITTLGHNIFTENIQ